ncbi:hypothetical protein Tco_0019411 [Tanacetum coccineum]
MSIRMNRGYTYPDTECPTSICRIYQHQESPRAPLITSILSYPTYQELYLREYNVAKRITCYAEDASPTAQSPDYVPDTDPEADPEEDDDEDPEEDPIDYPADGGDEREDDEMDIEENETMNMDIDADDEAMRNDEMDVEVDEERGRWRELSSYPRITIPEPLPVPAWSDSEVPENLLLISPPQHLQPQIPFPLLPPLTTTSPILYDYRTTTSYSPYQPDAPPPLPTSALTYHPTTVNYHTDSYEAANRPEPRPARGLRADYGFVTTMDRDIRRDPERYVGYGITDSWDRFVETITWSSDNEQALSDYWPGRVPICYLQRPDVDMHITRPLMRLRLRMSRESADHNRRRAIQFAWVTDRGRREEMRELRAADHTRQQQIIQTLTIMQTLQREMIPLQGLVTTLQGQVTALQGQVMTLQGQVTALQGQQGPTGGPAQLELPGEAGSST